MSSKLLWNVYVLRCTAKSGRKALHVGIALDVDKRIAQHTAGKVKATRGKGVEFVCAAGLFTKGEALSVEAQMKRLDRSDKTLRWLTAKYLAVVRSRDNTHADQPRVQWNPYELHE